MPTIETDGVALAYEDSGESDLRPIVFLHGLSQAGSTWAPVIPAVAKKWRVLTLDQRGHGDSEHAPGTYVLTQYGSDTEAFLERVVGEPTVVVGHSLGGVIATYVAQRRPDVVRGLFLEDPPLFRATDGPSREPSGVAAMFPIAHRFLSDMRERNAPLVEYENIVRAAPSLARQGTFTDVVGKDGVAAIAKTLSTLDPDIFATAMDGTALAGVDPTATLHCPVHVVRADPAFGPAFTAADEARFVAANPHAVVEMFEGTSHAIHDEQPERYRTALTRFLETLG